MFQFQFVFAHSAFILRRTTVTLSLQSGISFHMKGRAEPAVHMLLLYGPFRISLQISP